MELRQEQKLKQTLSQNMLQSTEILQMGQLELKEYLEDLALENPVVDMDEMRSEKSSDDKGESNEDFIRRLEEPAVTGSRRSVSSFTLPRTL